MKEVSVICMGTLLSRWKEGWMGGRVAWACLSGNVTSGDYGQKHGVHLQGAFFSVLTQILGLLFCLALARDLGMWVWNRK